MTLSRDLSSQGEMSKANSRAIEGSSRKATRHRVSAEGYAKMLEYVEIPGNLSKLLDGSSSPKSRIEKKSIARNVAFRNMAVTLGGLGVEGIQNVTGNAMKKKWERYRCKYMKAKALIRATGGGGLTKSDFAAEVTLENTLEHLCPHFWRMDAVFAARANRNALHEGAVGSPNTHDGEGEEGVGHGEGANTDNGVDDGSGEPEQEAKAAIVVPDGAPEVHDCATHEVDGVQAFGQEAPVADNQAITGSEQVTIENVENGTCPNRPSPNSSKNPAKTLSAKEEPSMSNGNVVGMYADTVPDTLKDTATFQREKMVNKTRRKTTQLIKEQRVQASLEFEKNLNRRALEEGNELKMKQMEMRTQMLTALLQAGKSHEEAGKWVQYL